MTYEQNHDWILPCLCGTGRYGDCADCPYTFCSVHGTPQGKAADELTRLADELGLYDSGPTVCVTHKRFVPCRSRSGECVWSDAEEDVVSVREWQRGIGLFFHVCRTPFLLMSLCVPGCVIPPPPP